MNEDKSRQSIMNSIKEIKKNILRIVLFFVVFAVCTYYVNRTLKDKNNYLKYSLFYEEEEAFDILFFGSSRMLNAVFPVELWTDFELTSYNMAQHGEGTNVSYWQIKNAFQYNKPKVVVVDLSLLRSIMIKEDDEEMKSYLHKSVDHIPFGFLKYEALKSVTEGVDLLEYMIPLTIYHNRWNELERNDFYLISSGRMGAERRVGIEKIERVEWSSDEKAGWVDVEYTRLQDMIDLCKEHGVELVFTCMPSVWVSALPNSCAMMNFLEEYTAEQGVPFLNFAKEDDMFNYAVDFYDSSHVNPSGGQKITHILGEFLTENYVFSEKKEHTKEVWGRTLIDYRWIKKLEMEKMRAEGKVDCYFMLLNDNDYTIEIRMKDETVIEKYGIALVLEELKVSDGEIAYGLEKGDIEVEVYDRETGDLLDYFLLPDGQ